MNLPEESTGFITGSMNFHGVLSAFVKSGTHRAFTEAALGDRNVKRFTQLCEEVEGTHVLCNSLLGDRNHAVEARAALDRYVRLLEEADEEDETKLLIYSIFYVVLGWGYLNMHTTVPRKMHQELCVLGNLDTATQYLLTSGAVLLLKLKKPHHKQIRTQIEHMFLKIRDIQEQNNSLQPVGSESSAVQMLREKVEHIPIDIAFCDGRWKLSCAKVRSEGATLNSTIFDALSQLSGQ